MLNGNHGKEKSMLLRKLKEKGLNGEVEVESVNLINKRNFNNTLFYNKNDEKYIANINFCGHNYKISIRAESNKANPKYEKKLKKAFSKL